MMLDFMREIRLDILATIASSDETLAYVLHRSDDPDKRKLADDFMAQSNEVKRILKDNLTGVERELYLLKAEGMYIPVDQGKGK